MLAAASAAVAACGGGGGGGEGGGGADGPAQAPGAGLPKPGSKSTKRGIAYDLNAAADYAALAPGVSWWYGWGTQVGG
eukprot:gene16251-34041_t